MADAEGSCRPGPEPRPRPRAHALELVLDPVSDDAVRRRWADLEEAGVPSMARHRGATHQPHLTVASGPAPGQDVLHACRQLLRPLLPAELAVAGLALLGPVHRSTLVELIVPGEALRAAREELTGLWAGADERPWVPHLTLARRLAPTAVAGALVALGTGGHRGWTLRLAVGVRWWDPDQGRAVTVVEA